jgi:hypothetical protein
MKAEGSADSNELLRVLVVFGDTTAVAYAAWFNRRRFYRSMRSSANRICSRLLFFAASVTLGIMARC